MRENKRNRGKDQLTVPELSEKPQTVQAALQNLIRERQRILAKRTIVKEGVLLVEAHQEIPSPIIMGKFFCGKRRKRGGKGQSQSVYQAIGKHKRGTDHFIYEKHRTDRDIEEEQHTGRSQAHVRYLGPGSSS